MELSSNASSVATGEPASDGGRGCHCAALVVAQQTETTSSHAATARRIWPGWNIYRSSYPKAGPVNDGRRLRSGSVRLVMTVSDPDAAFDRAVKAGARVVAPVSDQYAWRLGRLVDPFGHHWEIGKPLGDSNQSI